jgi:hypothetical protein
MKPVVFVGPSLSGDPVLKDHAFDFQPPAAQGDFYRAARERPKMIGLIDGVFESVRSVWHKEILWALSNEIAIYGAASMGALRAVELRPFGMIGVGAIYRDFRDGVLTDDDEVALIHAPRDQGYLPLTEAMVDIRATLVAAAAAKIVSKRTAARLTAIAKELFYKDRTWKLVGRIGAREGLSRAQLSKLKAWLPENRVEQKRLDARAMLRTMRRDLMSPRLRRKPQFEFQNTGHWQGVVEETRGWH